jgi:hypothetical protein
LEREKIDALRLNKWNFDAKMMLSNECFEDINWWKMPEARDKIY